VCAFFATTGWVRRIFSDDRSRRFIPRASLDAPESPCGSWVQRLATGGAFIDSQAARESAGFWTLPEGCPLATRSANQLPASRLSTACLSPDQTRVLRNIDPHSPSGSSQALLAQFTLLIERVGLLLKRIGHTSLMRRTQAQ